MRLYLIRHPAPLLPPSVCYGATDIAVAPQELARVLALQTDPSSRAPAQNLAGSRQAAQKPFLISPQAHLPRGLPLYSSPLQRCRCLAEPLAIALDATTLTFDERLVEMNFGTWEQKSWDLIPRIEIDAWTADLVTYRPGAGETVLEMAHRVQAFHTQMRAAQQDAIIICHAGTIRLLLACQLHIQPQAIAHHAASTTMKLAYGELVVVDVV